MKVSLIIPCYNEEENIDLFFRECLKKLENTNYKFCAILYITCGIVVPENNRKAPIK